MRDLRRIFPIFALLLFCLPATAQRGGRGGGARGGGAPNEGRGQAGPSLKIERDLEYARPGGQPLTLDSTVLIRFRRLVRSSSGFTAAGGRFQNYLSRDGSYQSEWRGCGQH